MPVHTIEDLAAEVGEGVLVGLDVGSKTLGVAASDRDWRFAHPRAVILRGKFAQDLDHLVEVLRAEGATGLVVGLPLHLDGSVGPSAQRAKAFVSNMLKRHDMPVAFWDERLSTVAAERALIEQDMRRDARAKRIDSAAAAFILQGALDRLVALQRQ